LSAEISGNHRWANGGFALEGDALVRRWTRILSRQTLKQGPTFTWVVLHAAGLGLLPPGLPGGGLNRIVNLGL
jgi:hypothetical protein